MKKRLLCTLLIFSLVCTACVIPGSGASDIIFVAVNDTIPSALNEASMPFYSGGTLYLPYTVFNNSALGVVPTYNTLEKTLTLATQSRQLLFSLSSATAVDENGTSYDEAALTRYGIVFVPASFCASYFGLSISYLTSLGGYSVVRLKTGDEVYSDTLFIEKAENLITYRVSQYTNAQEPPASSGDSSSTTSPGSPSTPSVPDSPEEPPDPADETEPDKPVLHLFLAIEGVSSSVLNYLDAHEETATFFLTAEEIAAAPDLVRRISGSGHTIGVNAIGEDEPADAIEAANSALCQLICTKTLLVLTDPAGQEKLQDSGWCVFTPPQEGETSSLLLLGTTDAITRLEILYTDGAELSPLRENSDPSVSAEPPEEASETNKP